MKKQSSALYARIVKILGSRILRNVITIGLLIFSLLFMFCLDQGNYVRKQYLPFLDDNFVRDVFNLLQIKQFNVSKGAWLLFFALFGTAVILFVANILSPKIIGKTIEKKSNDFKSPASCKAFYTSIYYAVTLVICAAIIFVCFMLDLFSALDGVDVGGMILNLTFTLLIAIGSIVLFILAIFLAYYIIKLIIIFLAYLVSSTKSMSYDIDKTNEKAVRDLEEARRYNEYLLHNQNNTASAPIAQVKSLFPSLINIDNKANEASEVQTDVDASLNLENLALRFQSFAINNHKIYYELPLIRSFIAGLAATRLIILEGLSGTGKSTLPRLFSEFTGNKAFFAPVQATWRDKTDILGFYSEFSKSYKATAFLERLYGANYDKNVNVMVLDEMNISRIEYYFADFLSVLEYPAEDWKIRCYEPQENQQLPEKLTDGYVTVPTNTWFVGTANTDDSTFTITDKVYDRAIVIDFKEKVMPITSDYSSESLSMTADQLNSLFEDARSNDEYRLNKNDVDKFMKLCDFMRDAFDVRFGNRIMVQIEEFVPVYVSLGGTKEEALDFMFSRKILRKLNGVFEDYVKEELANLMIMLKSLYGKGVFKETESGIAKILKRLV